VPCSPPSANISTHLENVKNQLMTSTVEETPMTIKGGTRKSNQYKAWLRSLGPGLIAAAPVFGPGKVTIASIMGASYGFSLLWIVAVAMFFMVIFTTMAAPRLHAILQRPHLRRLLRPAATSCMKIIAKPVISPTAKAYRPPSPPWREALS
jgi:hypothetical protein